MSEHSAQLTSLPIGFCTWLSRYICLLLLILMLWHRQVLFESKGDKLSSSGECRIRTQGLWNRTPSRMNPHWQTDWAIEDQANNLNSIARPYEQRAFTHSTPLPSAFAWLWRYTCLLFVISMLWHRQAGSSVALRLWGPRSKLGSSKSKSLKTGTYIHISHACMHRFIHVCWFNVDALVQGDAYNPQKPTKQLPPPPKKQKNKNKTKQK